jgi:hypothetical protein
MSITQSLRLQAVPTYTIFVPRNLQPYTHSMKSETIVDFISEKLGLTLKPSMNDPNEGRVLGSSGDPMQFLRAMLGLITIILSISFIYSLYIRWWSFTNFFIVFFYVKIIFF